ncbi:hypothetical protein COV13_00715 [Candidatus Woesearchaeota archaeon CG10_big_fil_rev_8_21_14_0_10_32_9]|nr:MAG: hypothetical protein COV13_00715 [Candidatus Woesearchaeota archaeon CG10_big_fil_rev_8_21_14_0_10_32_9]
MKVNFTKKVSVSVVVPVVNAEKFIKNNVLHIEKYLKNNKNIEKYEIIVSVQTSKDKTWDIAKKLKSATIKPVFSKKKGKWVGLKKGFVVAKYSWIVMLDSDLSYPIEFLDDALKHTEFDIIIGSRYVKGVERHNIPVVRKFFSWGYRTLVRVLFGLREKDIQVGCKLIRKEIFRNIEITDDSWVGDTELLYKSKKKGYISFEVPIDYGYSLNELSVSKAAPKMFFAILKLRLKLWGLI